MDEQYKQKNITKELPTNILANPALNNPTQVYIFTISSRLSISWTSKRDFPCLPLFSLVLLRSSRLLIHYFIVISSLYIKPSFT